MNDDNKWPVYDTFATLENHCDLKILAATIDRALRAEERGEWARMELYVEDAGGDYGTELSIKGWRAENDADRRRATERAVYVEQQQRALFESLKKRFEGQ